MTKREYSRQLKDYPAALTVAEVAEILRVSTKTVYKMIKENKLPAVKVGRENRVAKSRLIEYLRTASAESLHPSVILTQKSSDSVWTCETTCGSVRVGRNEKTKGVMQNGEKNQPACRKRAV